MGVVLFRNGYGTSANGYWWQLFDGLVPRKWDGE